MKKTVVILMILTIISKILGFTRDLVLSFFYGASYISDAYLISLTIPIIIVAIIGEGISTGFIPMYSGIKNKEGIRKADSFTNNLINVVITISTFIIITGLVFTKPIVQLFASGFEENVLELTVLFTRITLIGIYFTSLLYVFCAYLEVKGFFSAPAIMGLPLNLLLIASIIMSAQTNLFVLAGGSLAAIVSQFLFILIYAYKKGYRYKPIIDITNINIKKMLLLALPAVLGSSLVQINLLVDRTLASQIAVGGISALNYSGNLNDFILGMFVLTISTVMYPKISKMAAKNNMNEIKKAIAEAITAVHLLVIPATAGYMVFSEPIITLLYGRGEFDEQAISMTSYAMFFYSFGLIGMGLREILSKAFFSLHDSKTPMINAGLAMILNIILNFVLSIFWGIGGLALATSISAIICSVLLLVSLRKKLGDFGIKNLSFSFLKIVFASIMMGGICHLTHNFLTNKIQDSLALLFSIGLGIILYFVIIYFMKIKDVDQVAFEWKNKWQGHKKEG
ncbi:murein biosynthesis integral membrane protein MurJ [Salibacterium salarium]|uniref:Probable lipid II flippase MurJ n=1 Tax=Salibacterium salarium TaxID=284579 RepID=A0A428N0P6_9BACI|nr:murein biosynthesis integral membrane protein MurJ [Salibacterium salarium]RSL31917.1 murein biosynthesis integral membrane protein MurJ [Salibacterium salarium]